MPHIALSPKNTAGAFQSLGSEIRRAWFDLLGMRERGSACQTLEHRDPGNRSLKTRKRNETNRENTRPSIRPAYL